MKRILYLGLISVVTLVACKENTQSKPQKKQEPVNGSPIKNKVSLIILGTVQDAGSPHIGCTKTCCENLFLEPSEERRVVSLGVVDSDHKKKYLFEATPDISKQLKALKNYDTSIKEEMPDGIFLTHAHIGHYTGLMYLGKEAMSSKAVPVFTMPKMKSFLEENGPWSQLVNNNNIALKELSEPGELRLTPHLSVSPIIVPHRDEYSETVGFTIFGPHKKVLFIPDIDKWHKWDNSIIASISKVDLAFIDATFYDGEELDNRDITQIPHPFVIESMALFKDLSPKEKSKIYFIHLNHTNPLLDKNSSAYKKVLENGFNVAHIKDVFPL
ncbi:pyrroloquinoline quinone biosynthesis protein PqqB [Sediminicola sp. YIK13]|nr:MBL fold metallo-hydrolase [Sediminicola sp. YIK13]ALM09288.1 pyrroloquinoline quinone biosynthesis protein PqqB [Sediminicola sp. YIK13]